MKSTEDINNLLAKHFSKEPLSEVQKAELEEWIGSNREEYGRLQRLMANNLKSEPSVDFDAVKAWLMVEPKLATKRHPSLKVIYSMTAVAASILIAVGITLFLLGKNSMESVQYANSSDNVEAVVLPDGTRVKLYPGSNAEYKASKDEGDRYLTLYGKAFFDVKKDPERPFIVSAYNVKVEVLGTSFLVDAKSRDNAEIYVKSGIVRVSSSTRHLLLRANEQVKIEAGKIRKDNIPDAVNFFMGKPQILKYTNAPIANIVENLEKIYQVKIDVEEGIRENKVTTQLKLVDLDSILVELSYLCNCKYAKIAENHYKLYYR